MSATEPSASFIPGLSPRIPAPSSADQNTIAAQVRAAGTSFYWAMRLLPMHKRLGMFSVYAFCRAVDDIADGDEGWSQKSVTDRRLALSAWRSDLEDVFRWRNPDRSSLLRMLSWSANVFDLDKRSFLDIIDGMEMDLDGPILRPSAAELDLYCDRVASAVGRLSVAIFGAPGADGMAVAHHLGRALQLTNVIRDVDKDAALGRIYLPREVLGAYGLLEVAPLELARHPKLPLALSTLGAQARRAFAQADSAMAQCPRGVMRPARLMSAAYLAKLNRIEAAGWRRQPEPVNGLSRLAEKLTQLWVIATRVW
jgi:presqualene diphosphate synthase